MLWFCAKDKVLQNLNIFEILCLLKFILPGDFGKYAPWFLPFVSLIVERYNLGQKIVGKFTKFCKIVFSVKCFAADF